MRMEQGRGIGKLPDQMYRLMQFDSVYELAEYANENPTKWKSAREDEPHYNLTPTYEDAHQLMMNGWHDIRPSVDGFLEPLRQQLGELLAVTTERCFDIVGFEPDIDRYLAGELECMIDDRMIEAPQSGKVFRLVVDVSMTFSNSSSSIAKRGAALAALVEAYILLGLQLEVWTEFTVRGYSSSDGYATCLVPITTAGDPLDIDALLFCIGHPDFGRRLLWSWGERYDFTREHMGFDNGYYGLHQNGTHFAARIGASSTVSLDGNRAMEYDPIKWITDQLSAQGVLQEVS